MNRLFLSVKEKKRSDILSGSVKITLPLGNVLKCWLAICPSSWLCVKGMAFTHPPLDAEFTRDWNRFSWLSIPNKTALVTSLLFASYRNKVPVVASTLYFPQSFILLCSKTMEANRDPSADDLDPSSPILRPGILHIQCGFQVGFIAVENSAVMINVFYWTNYRQYKYFNIGYAS